MKSWLQDNDKVTYSTNNDGKSIAERFIRTLKNKNLKYMTSVSKNVHINKLATMANVWNHIYHSTIKMNSVDAKSGIYIDFNVENNDEDHKLEVTM